MSLKKKKINKCLSQFSTVSVLADIKSVSASEVVKKGSVHPYVSIPKLVDSYSNN